MIETSASLKPWRQDLAAAALGAMGDQPLFTGPIHVHIRFKFQRPKAHFNSKGELKPFAPEYKTTIPDLDKLVRTLDAFTGVIWEDDRQVVHCHACKLYCFPGERPGAEVIITPID